LGSSNLPKSILPPPPAQLSTSVSSTKRSLKRGETATWKISTIDQSTYCTEESEEFVNPTKKILKKNLLEGEYYDQQNQILCQNIRKKFQAVIANKFGSLENLFATVSLVLNDL
jgi:hypothetical protein